MSIIQIVAASMSVYGVWLGSSSDSVFLQRCKVVGLGFCRWDVSDWLEQAAVIEPVDPFEGGVFNGIDGFPRAFPPDDFGLVESIALPTDGSRPASARRSVYRILTYWLPRSE